MSEMLSLEQAARKLNMAERDVDALARSGGLLDAELVADSWQIPEDSVIHWLQKNVETSPSLWSQMLANPGRLGRVCLGAITALAAVFTLITNWDQALNRLRGSDTEAEIAAVLADLQTRNPNEVISDLQQRYAENRGDPSTAGLLGIAQLEQGLYNDAQISLREAKAVDRTFECYLGHALLQTEGVTTEVMELAGEGLDKPRSPTEIICLQLQVDAALLDGRPAASMTALLSEVVRLPAYRDSVQLLTLAAQIHAAAGNHPAAIDLARSARSLQGSSVAADLSLLQVEVLRAPSPPFVPSAADREATKQRIDDLKQRLDPFSVRYQQLLTLEAMHAALDDPLGQASLQALREAIEFDPNELQVQTLRSHLATQLISAPSGNPPGPQARNELRGLGEHLVADSFARTFEFSGHAIAALVKEWDGEHEAAKESLAEATYLEQTMAWDYFQVPVNEDDGSLDGPAAPVCQQSGEGTSCVELLGTWRSEDTGSLLLFEGQKGLIYGVYEEREGELVGTVEGSTLRGLWCERVSSGRQGGSFELGLKNDDQQPILDGRWQWAVAPTPDAWNDDWDFKPDVNAAADLHRRAFDDPAGCKTPN